jgi:hypothetical protein
VTANGGVMANVTREQSLADIIRLAHAAERRKGA